MTRKNEMRKKGERKEEIQEKEEGIIFENVYLFLDFFIEN